MKKPTKDEESLGFLLTQSAFLKQRLTNAALKELDVTYVQFLILAATQTLGADGQEVTQQIIASKRRLDKAMVSNVVKTLVEKKLMTRKTHPSDKRAFVLKLTEAGEDKATAGKLLALKVDKTFFAGVDKAGLKQNFKTLLNSNSADETL